NDIKTKNIIHKEGNATTSKLKGTETFFEADSVIIAISQSPKNNISGIAVTVALAVFLNVILPKEKIV
ncbi:MAG: hypothetical protein PWP67_2454, partial [Clostridium butyricum]|nr:hypothetical protein [Clostridium butyricum]